MWLKLTAIDSLPQCFLAVGGGLLVLAIGEAADYPPTVTLRALALTPIRPLTDPPPVVRL